MCKRILASNITKKDVSKNFASVIRWTELKNSMFEEDGVEHDEADADDSYPGNPMLRRYGVV